MSPLANKGKLPALLILAILLNSLSLRAGEAATDPAPDPFADWEAFLDETDSFLEEADDPLGDFDVVDTGDFVFWTASVRGGAGHSTNFLKRADPVSSPYLKLEGDLLLNALFESSSLTSLIFFEAAQYDREAEVDHEAIAFAHVNWTQFRGAASRGIEFTAFYGDQIYDASLLENGPPSGASLRQFRPEIAVFSEHELGETDTLKVTASVRRDLFGDEEYDYWRPQAGLEWGRLWSSSFATTTELSVYKEFYDEKVARSATGINLVPASELEITGLQIEELIIWKPVQLKALSTTVRFGAATESDPDDEYDGLTRLWASFSGSLDLDWIRLRALGTWQNTRYHDRQVGFVDTRQVRETYRTLELEAEKSLPWNLSLKAGVQWNELRSPVAEDAFSERRVQALLDWTY
jgi:hypothetical protein